eukprot:TRINITY_DN5305_c0_g4_i2.p2 TRINITY_DN5305_c0_g4~~TRINITY_DN5305_c0_g4_i2.p2  ORF type:complete len:130 (+),score=21.10 TRINITY_DN5305_c0_g4_i2:23-391(+)
MIRRPPRSTPLYSSAASDVYKRQVYEFVDFDKIPNCQGLNFIVMKMLGKNLAVVKQQGLSRVAALELLVIWEMTCRSKCCILLKISTIAAISTETSSPPISFSAKARKSNFTCSISDSASNI